MKMKRVATALLAVVISLSAFAGCGKKKDVITMVTNPEFPPFEYLTSEENGIVGKFSGVDIAISKAIADSLGKELEIQNMEFTAVLMSVSQGKADFAAAGITASDERRESMDFSDTYYVATQYIIVKEDNTTITSAADLMDKAVGVVESYTGETQCRNMGVANLRSFKRGVDAVNELKSGRIDAVVIDSHTAVALIQANTDVALKYVTDPSVFESEEYAIAVKKGNTELLESINEVLAQLKADGKIEEFVALYTQDAGMEEEETVVEDEPTEEAPVVDETEDAPADETTEEVEGEPVEQESLELEEVPAE